MNIYLKQFIKENFKKPGVSLDLGAGDFYDVACLELDGWRAYGIDKNQGVDLEKPFEQYSCDLVYSNYVLHLIKNKDIFLQSAYDNLKEGGYFFLHTFDKSDKHSNGIEEISLVKLVQSAGFKGIKTKIFDYYDNEHEHWHKMLEVIGQK